MDSITSVTNNKLKIIVFRELFSKEEEEFEKIREYLMSTGLFNNSQENESVFDLINNYWNVLPMEFKIEFCYKLIFE
jgi:hypothetical protein